MQIYKCINVANDLNLNKPDEAKIRKHYQIKAKVKLSELHSQIKLNISYLETSYAKYENLILIMTAVKQLLNKWIESDQKRT